LALFGKSLSNPTGFPRHGKSVLYQYFHRPGQNLFVRGYNNDEERQNSGHHQNELEATLDSDWSEAEQILESLMEKRSAPSNPLQRDHLTKHQKPWYYN